MSQRHKNRRGRRGTGQPDPRKDRTSHEAARGKKVSLDYLSKELPGEHDLESFAHILSKESDRSAAIMASSFLEQALWVMLTAHLVDAGDAARKEWFEGPNAPFRSFSAKIALGHAIGIYGTETKRKLDLIRNIRNVFAHRSLPLDFTHPTVLDECRKLFEVEFLETANSPAKTRYCSSCLWLADRFVRNAFKHGGKDIELEFP